MMMDLIASVQQAQHALDSIGRRPMRVIAGPRAWYNLVKQIDNHPLMRYAIAAYSSNVRIHGLPVIVRQDKHPDYLAVEYNDGTVLPVAET